MGLWFPIKHKTFEGSETYHCCPSETSYYISKLVVFWKQRKNTILFKWKTIVLSKWTITFQYFFIGQIFTKPIDKHKEWLMVYGNNIKSNEIQRLEVSEGHQGHLRPCLTFYFVSIVRQRAILLYNVSRKLPYCRWEYICWFMLFNIYVLISLGMDLPCAHIMVRFSVFVYGNL